MATVGLLPEMMVTRVYDALLASSIAIESLLSAMPAPIRGGLSHAPEPQQRLAQALMSLNNHRTSDEPPPLLTFLEWASRKAGVRIEGAVFREALSLLEEGVTAEQAPEVVRQRRPWYLSIVKRLYRQQGFSELDASESVSPVFVGFSEMRARVVGIAVGELHRTMAVVQDHVRFMKHGAFSVEGHIIFPETAPTLDEEKVILDAGLLPIRLEALQRRVERHVRMKVAPSASGVTSRQTAWNVERCKKLGELKTLERLRDSTAERLADLVNEVRADRARHVLVRATSDGLLAIASCALLTAWNEIHQAHQGPWPLYLSLEHPFPIDLDDLLDRVLSEQRVTSERTVADSLFSDEESIPVVCCGATVGLGDVQDILHPILVRKRCCIVLASESGSRNMGALLRSRFSFAEVSFPADFAPETRHVVEQPSEMKAMRQEDPIRAPGPIWQVTSVTALWVHPDCEVLVRLMKCYSSPGELRAVAARIGFDVSRVTFHLDLDRAARELVERAFNSDHLHAVIEAMRDDPIIRKWSDDVGALLEREP